MHANLPKIAKRWEKDYASGGIARLGFYNGNTVAPFPGIQQNNMLTNMQSMSPLALSVMTGQHQPGISPHRGGYGPIDPYGNIQMMLEKDDIRSGANVQQQPAWYQRMLNKAGQGITGLKNQMGNMFTGAQDAVSGIFSGAKNKGGALMGNIMGMAMGIPGLGALLGNIRPDNPYEKFQKQMFSDMYGGHDFGNKDPFGKNVRSLFGEYDVIEQADKFAASKLGQKRNFAEVMADGIITQDEIDEYGLDKMGGYQLNRLRTLAAAKKKAQAYQENIANRAKEERMAKERERQAQMARSNKVVLDRPQGPRGDGGGSWHAQTAAKEKAFADTGGKQGKVAGPGFGKGSYFSQGGIVSLWPK